MSSKSSRYTAASAPSGEYGDCSGARKTSQARTQGASRCRSSGRDRGRRLATACSRQNALYSPDGALNCARTSRGDRTDLTSLEQARRIAGLAQEKLAKDVVILDMRPVCTYTDFFVICSGQNPRQTKSIWDEVHVRLKKDGRALPRSVEGVVEAAWIVADYLDVVLHVFTPETRSYYKLEELWGDVPLIAVEAAAS